MPQSTIKLLENFIDYCTIKNKVISNNIANIGTKNYHARDVVFKDVLASNIDENLKTTDEQHIGSINPADSPKFEIVTEPDNNNVSGVNDVDIDKEMSELAVNNLNFRFSTKNIGDYFRNMQMVIKGGS